MQNRIIKHICGMLGILLCSSALLQGATKELETNQQIIKDLVHSALVPYMQMISERPSLYYSIDAPEAVFWLLEEQLDVAAKQNSIENCFMVHNEPDTSLKVPAIHLKWLGNTIEYKSGSLLPENHKTRLINLSMYIKLADSGRLLASDEYRKTMQDTVLNSDIKKLENEALPFTIGKKSNRFMGLFEPLLVISVTGTIIYIFYAFRSN